MFYRGALEGRHNNGNRTQEIPDSPTDSANRLRFWKDGMASYLVRVFPK
ncbi:MAG TPA: hypothetical protein PL188_02715 [Candidatus Cloacimonadota bacterium]|nr:hypothetical protein [Candidatus Cloacimonadota bacterium]